MRTSRALLALLTAMALVLGACGGDAGEVTTTVPSAASETTLPDSPADPDGDGDSASPPAPPSGPQVGSVVVDGTTYALNEALLCEEDELLQDLGLERAMELQGLGRAADGRVQIDLYMESFAGTEIHDVSWFGPEGIFTNSAILLGASWVDEDDQALPGPPITVSSGRATGSMVLYDATGSGSTIEVSFDVEVPTELFECR
jgi:hypothetical protein